MGGEERLTDEERRIERLLLGLRKADGIPSGWVDPGRVGEFVDQGLAERRDGRVVLTDRGMLLANGLVLALAD
jgi:oxygen-independent coproporphyrinogen-3 oxidase